MVFFAPSRQRIVSCNFMQFNVGKCAVQFVTCFKYLGRMISDDLTDDGDVQREIRNMFVRTNILLRKFNKC